jgi:hypothetical protein
MRILARTLLLTFCGAASLIAQGVRLGESYPDVYSRLRAGSYQDVRPQTANGQKEIATRRQETVSGKQVDIDEFFTFTADNRLKMIESHYFCKDQAWLDGFLQERHSKFTSQWGDPTFEPGENYYWWASSAGGDMTMLAARTRPEDRAKYVSVVYTRQNLLQK